MDLTDSRTNRRTLLVAFTVLMLFSNLLSLFALAFTELGRELNTSGKLPDGYPVNVRQEVRGAGATPHGKAYQLPQPRAVSVSSHGPGGCGPLHFLSTQSLRRRHLLEAAVRRG